MASCLMSDYPGKTKNYGCNYAANQVSPAALYDKGTCGETTPNGGSWTCTNGKWVGLVSTSTFTTPIYKTVLTVITDSDGNKNVKNSIGTMIPLQQILDEEILKATSTFTTPIYKTVLNVITYPDGNKFVKQSGGSMIPLQQILDEESLRATTSATNLLKEVSAANWLKETSAANLLKETSAANLLKKTSTSPSSVTSLSSVTPPSSVTSPSSNKMIYLIIAFLLIGGIGTFFMIKTKKINTLTSFGKKLKRISSYRR